MKKASVVLVISLLAGMVTYGQSCGNSGNDRVIQGNDITYAPGGKITLKGGASAVGGSIILKPGDGMNGDGNVIIDLGYSSSRVGIGTTSPADKLDVNGTVRMTGFKLTTGATNGYVLTSNSSGVGTWQSQWLKNGSDIYYSGEVGIGTPTPQYKLHVEGQTYTQYNVNNAYALVVSNDGGDGCGLDVKAGYGMGEINGIIARFRNSQECGVVTIKENAATSIEMSSSTDYALNIYNKSGNGLGLDVWAGYGYDTTGIIARFRTTTDTCMIIRENGNVGIGTADPGNYKLAVNGHIRTKEITVETDWSDFVFADNYQLMPLDKLEQHIKKERSLPGIPKENEVVENGVNIGEMQAKLLEKVEELTLYVIELKKENEYLKRRIDALEN
jgi:hypothetical protein